MLKGRRQIRNPYVRFARGATGPYANKLKRGTYGKTFHRRGGSTISCSPGRVGAADFSDWGTISASVSGEAPTSFIPASGGEGQKYVFLQVSLNNSSVYTLYTTFSAGPGSNWVRLAAINTDGVNVGVYFNVANGTIGTQVGAALLNSSIESIGGGKYRASITFDSGFGTNNAFALIYAADADNDINAGGDGSTVWHFQEDAFLCEADNLWTDSPDSVGPGWTNNLDGTYTCDGTDGTSLLQNVDAGKLEDDGTYRIAFEVSGYIGGSVEFYLGGTSKFGVSTVVVSANGSYVESVVINTAGAPASNVIEIFSNSFNGTLENIFIAKI